MLVFFYIGITVALLYGVLSMVAGFMQLKVKNIPVWLAVSMTLSGLLLIFSSVLLYFHTLAFYLLLFGLLFLHLVAVINGYYLYSKLHVMHHIIRLFVSLSILGLLVPYTLHI